MSLARHVYWKELRLWVYPAGRLSRQLLLHVLPAVLIVGVLSVFVLLGTDGFRGSFVPLMAAMSGGSVGVAVALDGFAGERERHTLETALATPVTPRQLLWGKFLAQATVAGGGILLMSLLALVVMLVVAGSLVTGVLLVVTFPLVVAGAMVLALYLLLAANLASLRAGSTKATGPHLAAYMLVGFAVVVAPLLLGVMLVAFLAGPAGAPRADVLGWVSGSIAIAALGLLAYIGFLVRAVLRETRPERFRIDL